MTEYYFAWWNLENLFDVVSSTTRSEKLQRTLGSELKGWTATVLNKKLTQLASVINQMNGGAGPDLLGVCEVESREVLNKLVDKLALPGRNYDIAHHASDDGRGIDVAFIYDTNWLTAGAIFDHVVMKRYATRDIVQVNFTTAAGTQLVVLGNHWPARSAGVYESEPYRIIAAETLAYYHERIRGLLGKDVPVIAMGDFNDAPSNRSLMEYALATPERTRVIYAQNPMFYNAMWPLVAQGDGSYYFDGYQCLDQLLVSKPALTRDSPFRYVDNSAEILRYPGTYEGRYQKPIRFGRPSKKSSFNEKGYSDHFPVGCRFVAG